MNLMSLNTSKKHTKFHGHFSCKAKIEEILSAEFLLELIRTIIKLRRSESRVAMSFLHKNW